MGRMEVLWNFPLSFLDTDVRCAANPQLSTELTTGRMEVLWNFPLSFPRYGRTARARDRESRDTYGLEIVSFSPHLLS
jgi:hypothetical protein